MRENSISGFVRQWWPSMIVVLVILYATWLPGHLEPSSLPRIANIDKWIHAIMFGGMASALMFDYARSKPRRPLTTKVVLTAATAACIFGLVDETVQGWLPIGRPSDWVDLLADWGGVAVALVSAPPAVKAVISKLP